MKKAKHETIRVGRSVITKIMLIFAFAFLSFAAIAQESARTPAYVDPASENPVVTELANHLKAHPGDNQTATALKYSKILNNPAAYPDMKASDLEKMKAEYAQLMDRYGFIKEQLASGVTYENATTTYSRRADKQKQFEKMNQPNDQQQSAPTISNGNQ